MQILNKLQLQIEDWRRTANAACINMAENDVPAPVAPVTNLALIQSGFVLGDPLALLDVPALRGQAASGATITGLGMSRHEKPLTTLKKTDSTPTTPPPALPKLTKRIQ